MKLDAVRPPTESEKKNYGQICLFRLLVLEQLLLSYCVFSFFDIPMPSLRYWRSASGARDKWFYTVTLEQ